jgi:hypothetical protein
MTVTDAQIAKLRRMVAEPTASTYSDDDIESYIDECAVMDENGEDPTYLDTSTTPPTVTDNDDWIATYDLNAAAANIWEEKAAALQERFDFAADGGNYKVSQAHENALKMAGKYRSRSKIKSVMAIKWPKEDGSIESDIVYRGYD